VNGGEVIARRHAQYIGGVKEQDITAGRAANQEARKLEGFTMTGGMTPESQDSCSQKFPD
jgi:hypothetical protein